VADCACLTGDTATVYEGDDIKRTLGTGNAEGLVNDELQGLKTEVLVDVTLVDGDSTRARNDANASYRLLSSAGAVEIGLCTSIHLLCPSFLSIKTRKLRASEPDAYERRRHKPSNG